MWLPARRIAALGMLGFAMAWVGCATPSPVNVVYDEGDDLSSLRTWDWIEGHAVLVRAPSHDAAALESELTGRLANGLTERGLIRAPGSGAMRVAALLVVYRGQQSFRRAQALQTLYSYHSGGNIEVQADEVELRPVDRMRLLLYVTSAGQERLLWQGSIEEQHLDGVATHLDDAIGMLLDEFPPSGASEQAAR